MSEPWGWHLIVDCEGCYRPDDEDHIMGFLTDLVQTIDMIPVGIPLVTNFTDLSPEKNGITVIQLIQTSSIVMHFCNEGNAFIDVFSCKYFDQLDVFAVVKDWFKPTSIRTRMLERG